MTPLVENGFRLYGRRNGKMEHVRAHLRRQQQPKRPGVVYFPIFVGATGLKTLPGDEGRRVYESRLAAERAIAAAKSPPNYRDYVFMLDVEYRER